MIKRGFEARHSSYRRLSEIDLLRRNRVELGMKGEFKRVMSAGLLFESVLPWGGTMPNATFGQVGERLS